LLPLQELVQFVDVFVQALPLTGPDVGEGFAVGPDDGAGVGGADGFDVGPGEGARVNGGEVGLVDCVEDVGPWPSETVAVAGGVAALCVGDPEVATGVGIELWPDSTTAGGEGLTSWLPAWPIVGTLAGPATAITPMAPSVAAPVPAPVLSPDRSLPTVGT
jgi:hypothetical protein